MIGTDVWTWIGHRRLGHADTNRSGRRITQHHVASMTGTDSSSDRHRCADVWAIGATVDDGSDSVAIACADRVRNAGT